MEQNRFRNSFAGLKSISESIIEPNLYFDVNVNGTKQLIKIMDENNCRKLVFSSSASVYSKEESPLNENSKVFQRIIWKTKLEVENILEKLLDCLIQNGKSFA